VIYIVTG
jgi:hypothetical protein